MHVQTARLQLAPFEHLNAWWGRVRELPAWQASEPPAMARD